MNVLRRHFRIPAIAFLAILGLSSIVGDAKASTPGDSSRTCCLKRVCNLCCCKPASSSGVPEQAKKHVVLSRGEHSVSAPARPCECRSSDPASPASSRGTRSFEERGDQKGNATVALTSARVTEGAFDRPVPPRAQLSHAPLYLRNARLLI